MRIIVNVIARARTESVEKLGAGMYKVRVRAVAERGKANDAVTAVLAAYFGVPRRAVRIVAGRTTSRKMVDIDVGNA